MSERELAERILGYIKDPYRPPEGVIQLVRASCNFVLTRTFSGTQTATQEPEVFQEIREVCQPLVGQLFPASHLAEHILQILDSAPSGPLSDEPRENENQTGAAPSVGELEWRTDVGGKEEHAERDGVAFELWHYESSDVLSFNGPNCRGQIESQTTRDWPKSLANSLQRILSGAAE